MDSNYPPLELLLHRMANCPAEFLEPPSAGDADGIQVAAIVCDLMRQADRSRAPEENTAALSEIAKYPPERQRMVAMLCWLLYDDWFLSRPELAAAMWRAFSAPELGRLAKLVKPEKLIDDPDRREELARLCLRSLGLRPEGETEAQAEDRLTTLDSVERNRILRATAAAERRAREIREAMARAAAQDAASRYGE